MFNTSEVGDFLSFCQVALDKAGVFQGSRVKHQDLNQDKYEET